MPLRICSLFFLFLFTTLVAHAQELPPEVERLLAGIARAKEMLRELEQKRDSLEALTDAVQDSASLQAALDSLQRLHADPWEQQADSLLQAFTNRKEVILQLEEAEQQLRNEIGKATEALSKELTPVEATRVLEELEKAETFSAKALVPDHALLRELKEGKLPAPEELQGLAMARAMKAAGKHLERQSAELNEARRELDKYKGRFEQVESVKDMPKGFLKLNPLKGKPFAERIFVGTLWQFGNQERFMIDMGPYAAWRFTDKISTGAGFQYRFSVSVDAKPWVSGSDKVLGFFGFTDVDVWKGVFGRLHYERLSTPVPRMDAAGKVERVGQEWVPGLSVGVGKNYTFYKAIQGYALVQYNLMHAHNRTPYLQPLQARIGFYILKSNLIGRKD